MAIAADPALALVGRGADAEPGRRIAALAEEHQVGDVYRRLLLHNPARTGGPPRLGMALDHVEPLHHRRPALGQDAQHLAGLAALASGDDHDQVVFLDRELLRHHSTSGASEIILRKRLARSSRATGP